MCSRSRYTVVSREKANGATYTPQVLADFVAHQICSIAASTLSKSSVRLLDPAVGHGQLLTSLLEEIAKSQNNLEIKVSGFETEERAIEAAYSNISQRFPSAQIDLRHENFLHFVLEHCPPAEATTLLAKNSSDRYDLVIANPPYVRTQIMGAGVARDLSESFGLTGRVDLYHAFILGIAQVLGPSGVAGIIVSNRFMTTKAGEAVRRAISTKFDIHHIWDLGDTKLFEAAVLPAVLILRSKGATAKHSPSFSSIYLTSEPSESQAANPIDALSCEGVVKVPDGRHFCVRNGKLSMGKSFAEPWRIATPAGDSWLEAVNAKSWGTFKDIGRIRVGIKTCADSVFIRSDWKDVCNGAEPELLRPLMTHHIARRFRPEWSEHPSMVLYPHETVDGSKRAVDLSKYPVSQVYLEKHRAVLEARKYVLEAGRKWYEIWVPQDPAGWDRPKLVFRDIAEHPTFWLDFEWSIVNGDCYWLAGPDPVNSDLLWLAAAVANSTFAEAFYDRKFHNKLYAGRRRFMTQYVEQFPLPDPQCAGSKALIEMAKEVYNTLPSSNSDRLEQELDARVWKVFGLSVEKV
jgi:hypothetical protein